MNDGFVHIYTGNGKGKTTAALGLAIRAVGAGKRVLFAQFLKKASYCEHRALERFSDLIDVRCFGTGEFIINGIKPEDHHAAQDGLNDISRTMTYEPFDLIVLDEVIIALTLGLISIEQLIVLIRERPPHCEIVLTGRGAPEQLIDVADLVTEMVEIKHYYNQGVEARRGIEL